MARSKKKRNSNKIIPFLKMTGQMDDQLDNDDEKSVPLQKKCRTAPQPTETNEMAVDRISNHFHWTSDEIMVIIFRTLCVQSKGSLCVQ